MAVVGNNTIGEQFISQMESGPINKDWSIPIDTSREEPKEYTNGQKITEQTKALEQLVKIDYADIAKIILIKNRELSAFMYQLKNDYAAQWKGNELQPYVGESVLRLQDACDNLTRAGNALFQMQEKFEKKMVDLPDVKEQFSVPDKINETKNYLKGFGL